MKKTVLGVAVLGLTLFAFNCQKNDKSPVTTKTNSPTQPKTGNINANAFVNNSSTIADTNAGSIHNVYVAAYLTQIQSIIATEGLSDFTVSDYRNAFDTIVLKDMSGTAKASLSTFSKNILTLETTGPTRYNIETYNVNYINNATNVSSTFKTIAVNLIGAANMPHAESKTDSIKTAYVAILAANPSLSSTESGIIIAALSVMQNSDSYWMSNASSWGNTLNPPNPSNVYDGGGVGGADVGGCIAGGVYGALVGGTVTLGAGTAPAWLVGALAGGISASIGKAAENWYNNLW